MKLQIRTIDHVVGGQPINAQVSAPLLQSIFWPNNYCIGEVECLLGSMLLDRLAEINNTKRERALKFIDELDEFNEVLFHRENSDRHNYHQLSAMFTNENRNKFRYRSNCT